MDICIYIYIWNMCLCLDISMYVDTQGEYVCV